jgi:hypothetical protein
MRCGLAAAIAALLLSRSAVSFPGRSARKKSVHFKLRKKSAKSPHRLQLFFEFRLRAREAGDYDMFGFLRGGIEAGERTVDG